MDSNNDDDLFGPSSEDDAQDTPQNERPETPTTPQMPSSQNENVFSQFEESNTRHGMNQESSQHGIPDTSRGDTRTPIFGDTPRVDDDTGSGGMTASATAVSTNTSTDMSMDTSESASVPYTNEDLFGNSSDSEDEDFESPTKKRRTEASKTISDSEPEDDTPGAESEIVGVAEATELAEAAGLADVAEKFGDDHMMDDEPTGKEGDNSAKAPELPYGGERFDESKLAEDGDEKRPLDDLPRGEPLKLALKTQGTPETDSKIFSLRMPNIIEVATEPESDSTLYQPSRGSEAVIRYREKVDEAGKKFRESNTFLVTWSDGTQQLVIGHHHFDILNDGREPNRLFLFSEHKNNVRHCHGAVGDNLRVHSDKARDALKVHAATRHRKKPKSRQMTARNLEDSSEFQIKRKSLLFEAQRNRKEKARKASRQRRAVDTDVTGSFLESGMGGRRGDDHDSDEEANDEDEYDRRFHSPGEDRRRTDRLSQIQQDDYASSSGSSDDESSDSDEQEQVQTSGKKFKSTKTRIDDSDDDD